MAELDQRIVRLGIEVDGNITWYEGLSINATGSKYAGTTMGKCEITIVNMNKKFRDYILRQTHPLTPKRSRVSVTLEVGRESYGTSVLYKGDVFRSESTEKPNIGLILRCVVGHSNSGKIVNRNAGDTDSLRNICQSIAEDNGYTLVFEIDDIKIKSYSFTGSAQDQLKKLSQIAKANVYVENKCLIVKSPNKPSSTTSVMELNKNTGMIGVPQGTEIGVNVTMLYHPSVNIGSQINLKSEINPHLDGRYVVFKLDFNISSRDSVFYLTAECNKI